MPARFSIDSAFTRTRETLGRTASAIEQGFEFPRGKGDRLIRPRHPRFIAGVCSAIAVRYGWNSPEKLLALRAVAVVLTLASSGLLGLLYVLAWVLIPEGRYALPGETEVR